MNDAAPASANPEPNEVKRIWRVGANIQAPARPVSRLLVTFPIPTDWPEQHVNLYQEEVPPEVGRADFRVSDGVKQMVATIPRIDPGERVEIHVLMEITVRPVAYPERTDHLVIPARPPRDVRLYLNPSPLINHRDRSVRNQVKEIVEGIDSPWEQVKAIYDWVTLEIEPNKESEVIGAERAIRDLAGNPEDMANVFIALCRANKVPARMVWADNGEYAEFYLQDDTGEGIWFPAVLEGKPEFGKMTNPRIIIQKGDNIRVPEQNQRQRFVVEHVRGSGGGARPRVRFIRDVLPSRDSR
ncbi:MAG: transglutaminase-like domain-containing protein [Pirellulaceae bacterium]